MTSFISWDLGATKCTAGIITAQTDSSLTCTNKTTIKLADTESLADLVAQIESQLNIRMRDADAICIGGAGQYDGHTLHHENPYPFPMPFADLAKKEYWPNFTIVHDYAPIVCATFTSYMHDASNLMRLNARPINPLGRRVAFGIGTGLGLKDGVQLPNGDFWLGRNEIGHIGISTPPQIDTVLSDRHQSLMRFLKSHLGLGIESPVNFEKILSGQGLVRLHQFLYPKEKNATPESVGARMQAGKADELIDLFAWYCGLFVGTVELIFMPEGGTWITGGVALHHLNAFTHPAFHAGILASPAYRQERSQYALGILKNPDHALIGGAYYAKHRLMDESSSYDSATKPLYEINNESLQ